MQLAVTDRIKKSFRAQARSLITLLSICSFFVSNSQETLDDLLKQYNTETVPYISVEEFSKVENDAIILDAREPREFKVSHVKNATCVGYDNFNINSVLEKYPDKNEKIVVYCSLGIRSEVVAKQLKDAGYSDVTNLYGGIFEWKNKGYDVVNKKGKITEKVHAFSKEWSKWLIRGKKVY